MSKTQIAVSNLSFSYGNQPVLVDGNFEIEKKDYVAIIGPNGGGKTTLMKLLLGTLTPQTGHIKLFGQTPQLGRVNIGYVPQHLQFDFDFPMTVLEVVLMGRMSVKNLGKSFDEQDRKEALHQLDLVGMKEEAQTQISKLSGGQRQRVLIARALATKPDCLILDEPASGIDVKWQEKFHALLRKLNEQITILHISHHIDIICGHVNKVLFVNRDIHLHESLDEAMEHIKEVYGLPSTITLSNVCH